LHECHIDHGRACQSSGVLESGYQRDPTKAKRKSGRNEYTYMQKGGEITDNKKGGGAGGDI
jgi:hypothetical protein